MCGCDDKLLQAVYETGFALDEATLYLDTHPNCPMAMQYFQNARRMNRHAMKAYEELNGPLQVADAIPITGTGSTAHGPGKEECADVEV